MAVISVLRKDGNNIISARNSTLRNIKIDGVDYHFANSNEVSDGLAVNAVAEPIIDMQISGNSEQQTYTGKNLFSPLIKNVRLNFTTGAVSTDENYSSTDFISVNFNTNVNYYLSGLIAGLNSCVFAYNSNKVFLGRTSGQARSYLSLNKDVFTAGTAQGEGDIAYLRISQYFISDVNTGSLNDIDNAKTQLEVGSTATDYEPFVGGVPSPNPDYPQEIESVGEKTINLVDIPTTPITTHNKTIEISLETGKVYTLSAKIESNGVSGRIRFIYNLNGTDIYSQNTWVANGISIESGFEIPEGATNIRILLQRGTDFDGIFSNIMVVEGTYTLDNLPEYEPYGYKIPVKVSGKNLFNINNINASSANYTINNNTISVLSNGNGTYRQVTYKKVPVQKSAQYYLNFQYEIIGGGTARISVYYYDEAETYIKEDTFYSSGVGQTPENAKYIEVRVYASLATIIPEGEGVTYSNIQIEYGTTASDYEPYIEPKTTNIYLSEPLRKFGDYLDYIDYKNKKIVRNVGKHIYNENDNWQVQNASYWFESGVTTAFYTQIPNDALSDTKGLPCLCNLFKYDGTGDGINKKVPYISGNIGSLVVAFNNETVSTLEELKTYLAQTNLEIVYALATPTEEIIDIPEIRTADGNNIFQIQTTIQPSSFNVNYWRQIQYSVNDLPNSD